MKIGVLGGGQLGQMLALAGIPLGFSFRFWEPAVSPPSREVGEIFSRSFDDLDAVPEFLQDLDVVTYEFENVPSRLVERIEKQCPTHPDSQALAASQDRMNEKRLFEKLGIPTVRWHAHAEESGSIPPKFLFPGILKTARLGYDGKGQAKVSSPEELALVRNTLRGQALILEELIEFEQELSLISVRNSSGEIVFYPLCENVHRHGILYQTRCPADNIPASIQGDAENYARRILEDLQYVGVLSIEFFLQGGALIANEMAPRVHNSGHWSIEGAATSQFENHIRAIAGLPLGSTSLHGVSRMLNLVGSPPPLNMITDLPHFYPHLYGKSGRPRRKIGHITAVALTASDLDAQFDELTKSLEPYQQFVE